MRLFVAFDLSAEVRQALRELVSQLQRASAEARWVRAEGLHLTLKFLGELPEEKLPALKEALARVSSPRAVEMEFRGVGYFPHARRPRVIWVGVRASENLPDLAAQVETAVEPFGVAREPRAYVPHLTLGRFKGAKRLPRLLDQVSRLPSTEFGHVRTTEFTLYQSRLSPAGAQYTRLESFAFVRP